MIWDQANNQGAAGTNTAAGPYGSNRAVVNFLYNPSEVDIAYDLNASDITSALMYQNWQDQASVTVPMQQTVSWSLLYDRTYETWGGPVASPNNQLGMSLTPAKGTGDIFTDPTVAGVNVDILAMKQFTGMLAQANSSSASAATGGIQAFSQFKDQGVMMVVYSWVYFGAPSGLRYYGYVADWSVQVTHWTQYMVPMRCVINIDFTLLPPPTNEPSTGAPLNTSDNWWSFMSTGVTPSSNTTGTGVSGR